MLTVHVLGRPESYLEDQTPVVPPTPMGETIYYYLVCERQPVTHAHIANLFWSNMATSEALAEWHTLLPTLHNAFGAYLKSTADQVAFNYQMDHRVDLYDLQYILLDDKIPARQKLEKIRTLYRGALLAETEERNDTDFGQWLHQHRQAIQRRVGEALQGLTEYFLQQDDFVFGFKTTRWWLTLEPGNEVAHRLRMNLFWRSKQRSAALLQYHICRSDLDSYFGSEPSAQTTELYLQILHEAVPGAPTRRVRANRIANPDIHNLPRRLTSFAGREKEIAALHRYLLEEKQRMVVIMGEGGVGKTGLALVAVEKILTNDKTAPYLDGIWFVSCAGIEAAANAAELLSINIGSAIGIQFRGAKTPFEQLSDYLASKTMLLILDNVEHLEPQISLLFTLLNRAPNLQLLLTSRHLLAIRHYQSLRLDGLETPIAAQEAITSSLNNEELAQLLATPSIQILSDRTRKIWPQFVINQENGVAAARLCRLLHGNPLAIELAATLIVEYDLAALVAELTRNYTLLAGDLQDLPPRQRSIYNTIDYTWRMLPPELAIVMAQCSVFRGTFSQALATTLIGASQQQLAQLQKRFLIHLDEQQNLCIHEMVRQFAAEKLAEDLSLQATIQRQHCDYYIELLCGWWEKNESEHIVAHLLPQLDNIYAAWEWAFSQQRYELLSHAIIPFTQFHIYAGLFTDIYIRINSYYQRLQKQRGQEPTAYQEMKSSLTYASGAANYYQSNYKEAGRLLAEAKTEAHEHGYLYLLANIERYLGKLATISLDLGEAKQHMEQGMRHAEEQNQHYSIIVSLLNLSAISNQSGRHEECKRQLQQVSHLTQRYHDVSIEATYQGIYGNLQHALGNWSQAVASWQRAINMILPQRFPADYFHAIGRILWQSGRYEQAKEYLEQVDSTKPNSLYRVGSYWHSIWLIDFANLYVAWQRPEQALFYSQLAQSQAIKQRWLILEGRALKAYGAAQRQLKQMEKAKESLTRSLHTFRQQSTFDHECSALSELIQLNLELDNLSALTIYGEDIWKLLHSGKLDYTHAEPTKAWWACYSAFQRIDDPRAAVALRTVRELFLKQLASIEDENWKDNFSNQIVEHHMLLQSLR